MKLRPICAASRASAGPDSATRSISCRAAVRAAAGTGRCPMTTSASSATKRRVLSPSEVSSVRPSVWGSSWRDQTSASAGSAALRTS